MLRVIRQGMAGDDIRRWQYFLTGQGLTPGEADAVFREQTSNATGEFQSLHGLDPRGYVDNETWAKAMSLGFEAAQDVSRDEDGPNWPSQPGFTPLGTSGAKREVFGGFTYVPSPVPSNPESVRSTDSWYSRNIIQVAIPQFLHFKDFPHAVPFHRLAVDQLLALWAAWEEAGLLHLILTWDGSYSTRFARGSRALLSNHAFGAAFDINTNWNRLGCKPALVGQTGSVRKLVTIANDHGFYWGGHVDNRPDGNHFEVAFIESKTKSVPPPAAVVDSSKVTRLNTFRLYSLSKRAMEEDPDLTQEGVDLVFDEYPKMLDQGYFEEVDSSLRDMNVDMLHADILITILVVTRHRPELKERSNFLDRVTGRIREIDKDKADQILDPLR